MGLVAFPIAADVVVPAKKCRLLRACRVAGVTGLRDGRAVR